MKRRKFLQSSVVMSGALPIGAMANSGEPLQVAGKEVYEWRQYDLKSGGAQRALDNYFQKALMPAYQKYGVQKIGVFKEYGLPEPPKIYLLIVYPSTEQYFSILQNVKNDAAFKEAGAEYSAIPSTGALFTRYITQLMLAFDGLPKILPTGQGDRIFEWRVYDGHNEDAVRRKVLMFNKEELDLFYKVKLNPVFFGENIAGTQMPTLSYMLTFKDMAERDANWSEFINHPEWKRMRDLPDYADTVSRVNRTFLLPLPYSQV